MAFAVPWWVNTALALVQFLPVPLWVKAIDTALQNLISHLPQSEQAQARAELDHATLTAVRTGDRKPLKNWAERHC